MSKKIRDVFNSNPNAGEDVSRTIYIPVDDGTNNEIAYSDAQLSATIAHRLGINYQKPISGTFSVVVPDDSTVATYLNNFADSYDRHYVTIGNDVPLSSTDGIAGPANGSIDLQDYTQKSVKLWTYAGGTWTQRTPEVDDGNGGFSVIAMDSTPPIITNFSLSLGTDPTSELDFSVSATDSESGLDLSSGIMRDAVTGKVIRSGLGLSGTLNNMSGSGSLTFEISDNNGNTSITNAVDYTMSAPGGVAGSIAFDNSGVPAITHNENAGNLSIPISITGNTDGDEKTVQVNLRLWTAEDTGQITDGSPYTATFNSANGYSTSITVTVTDKSSTQINRIEAWIDPASVTSGAGFGDPAVGDNNAILIDIVGSGAGSGAYQEYDPGDGTGRIVVDADAAEWKFRQDTVNNVEWLSEDSSSPTNVPARDDAATGAPTNMHIPDANTGDWVNQNYIDGAALAEIDIEVSTAGNWYVWMRGYTNSLNYTQYAGFDRNQPYYDKYAKLGSQGSWQWARVGKSGDGSGQPLAYNLSAGTHTFYHAMREISQNVSWDRFEFTTDINYVPTDTAAAKSTQASGTPTANQDNPQSPIGPITSTKVTPTLSPADNSSGVSAQTKLTLSYAGGTGIVIDPSALVVKSNGGVVSGRWTTNGIDTAIFTPDSSLADGASIEITGTDYGSIRDTDGARKSFVDIASGDWNFTVDSATSGNIIKRVTFDTATGVPRAWTDQDTFDPNLFDSENWNTYNFCSLVDDPYSNGRGKCMQLDIPQGTGAGAVDSADRIVNIFQLRDYNDVYPNNLDYYMAMDIAVQPGFIAPRSMHLMGLICAYDHSTHPPGLPNPPPHKALVAFQFYGGPLDNLTYPNKGQNAMACYVYRGASNWYGGYFWNSIDPTNRWSYSTTGEGQVRIPTGRWFTVELRAKLNTFTAGSPNSDGILQAWLDGSLVLDVQNVLFISDDGSSVGGPFGWNTFWWNVTEGGAKAVALQDDRLNFDNIIISKAPITH